jgi:hypothetical protein
MTEDIKDIMCVESITGALLLRKKKATKERVAILYSASFSRDRCNEHFLMMLPIIYLSY